MFEQLVKTIGYQFTSEDLLKQALTHPSISYIKQHKNSYERLEFLGDTVLSMVIAEMLFINFPYEEEGDLSKRHVELVKGTTLATVAKTIGLNQYIIMSDGEKRCGGSNNMKILENVMEAIIGAIYIDGGFHHAQHFIKKYWMPLLLQVKLPPENVKSTLQEWAQKRGLAIPIYRMLKSTGLAHSPVFTIELSLEGFASVQVEAKNKRAGEQKAAALMLDKILK